MCRLNTYLFYILFYNCFKHVLRKILPTYSPLKVETSLDVTLNNFLNLNTFHLSVSPTAKMRYSFEKSFYLGSAIGKHGNCNVFMPFLKKIKLFI